ncbi:BrnT family toxin [Desulfobotulus mexicanus]|uniref:BrnT family toxin n=1 Tax=Desulfobotulus mexicanus TaxID=2586642 RepID=A0A5S5MDS3_9BACT|nr:BrnT family toxin [Desulfobotulus mexicanus]TYT73775.1 BrnT family toxin [Desulfobotulus mexicanus]
MLNFEWHLEKAGKNIKKHNVTFEEASTAFGDPFSLTIEDPLHSEFEQRFVLIGKSYKDRILVVVHIERDSSIRIISARKATKKERGVYESKEG